MDDIKLELEQLTEKSGGVLFPERVVDFARDPSTALHAKFTWDDTAAAHQWRLMQARKLINIHLTVITPDTQPVPIYVSLHSDRAKKGGGYRKTVDVMQSPAMRAELLDQALAEADTWMHRYHALDKLADVFSAIEVVQVTRRKRAAVG